MAGQNEGAESARDRARIVKVEKELDALRRELQTMKKQLELEVRRRNLERDAEARNTELRKQVHRIGGVLLATLASQLSTIDGLYAATPPVERLAGDELPAAPRWADFEPRDLGIRDRFGHRRRAAEEEAEQNYEAARRAWKQQCIQANKRHAERVEQVAAAHRRRVQELVDAALRRDATAVEQLAHDLLHQSKPLVGLLADISRKYDPETRELALNVKLPGRNVIPTELEWIAESPWRDVRAAPRSDCDVAALYIDLAGQVALAVAVTSLRAFDGAVVDVVRVTSCDSDADISWDDKCIVEVAVPRAALADMEAARLAPQDWLRKLSATVAYAPPE